MTREQLKVEIVEYCDMKGKGAHNVFQKVSLRVKDFVHIDDITQHLDSQIDKSLNEAAAKYKKRIYKERNDHGTIQLLKGRRP